MRQSGSCLRVLRISGGSRPRLDLALPLSKARAAVDSERTEAVDWKQPGIRLACWDCFRVNLACPGCPLQFHSAPRGSPPGQKCLCSTGECTLRADGSSSALKRRECDLAPKALACP
nr:unnamed protein product [Rangifer tarandus platyrhynchus]